MASVSSPSAVVLLSGGLDSTFNLYKADKELSVVLALTFDYGQKAALREKERAAKLAAGLGIRHHILPLPWFKEFTRTALVATEEVPSGPQVRIDDLNRSLATAKSVWVPNRNGILLNIAAGFAEGLGAHLVIPGFNKEEAATFPDNTGDFLRALDSSWDFSTATKVRGHCFTTEMTKSEIVSEGIKLGLPFHQLWPCYLSGESWCGECESCLRFKRAAEENGISFAQLQKGGKD